MRLSPIEYQLLCAHFEACFRGDSLPSINDPATRELLAIFNKLATEIDRAELQRIGNYAVGLALRRLWEGLHAERTARTLFGKQGGTC